MVGGEPTMLGSRFFDTIMPQAYDIMNETEGDFTWDSYQEFADANDFTGETVTISGPWLTADQESFENVFAYFEAATGADVVYAG